MAFMHVTTQIDLINLHKSLVTCIDQTMSIAAAQHAVTIFKSVLLQVHSSLIKLGVNEINQHLCTVFSDPESAWHELDIAPFISPKM